jgi:hypothetical protein
MSELRIVDRAAYSPTQCALCLAHEGPFIDTGAEFIGYGHVYICASREGRSGCVRQMARFDRMTSTDDHDAVLEQVKALNLKISELEAELAESRVVPMHEVVEFLKTKVVARPTPAPVGRE